MTRMKGNVKVIGSIERRNKRIINDKRGVEASACSDSGAASSAAGGQVK